MIKLFLLTILKSCYYSIDYQFITEQMSNKYQKKKK